MSLNFDNFEQYIYQMAEKKKTSPSGIHLAIYKSLSHEQELLRISFRIISITISSRIILPKWRQTHQLLLQKDSQPHIHRLRYITILEVDVQFVMKLWWARELEDEVDKRNLI